MRTRLKVCCIASVAEARLAIAHGADAVGLVSAMPSGPGVIPDETCAAIARAVPLPVASVLLTSRTEASGVAEQAERIRPSAVQLVDGAASPEAHEALHRLGIHAIQVVHVEDETALPLAQEAARTSDAVLLDSGRPSERVLGGTGERHDWNISREIVAALEIPVFLAGGLTPANAPEAIRRVRPFALDVCSGVRTAGALDPAKLGAFARAIALA